MSKKVLIITDKAQSFDEYKAKLKPAEFEVIGAGLADADLFQHIRELKPAIVPIKLMHNQKIFGKIGRKGECP
jgi:hypothetical protein